jgi:hypothetical protein
MDIARRYQLHVKDPIIKLNGFHRDEVGLIQPHNQFIKAPLSVINIKCKIWGKYVSTQAFLEVLGDNIKTKRKSFFKFGEEVILGVNVEKAS